MKEIKRHLIFYIFIIPLLYLSCKKENMCDCFKSTGNIISETRNISGFDSISVENNVNLFLTEDSIFSVTVEAGRHLISLIKTDVTDNCLFLKNENKCNWVRSFKNKINVYVHCPKIKEIIYKGSGNIKVADTLHVNNFQLDDWNGTGEVNLILKSNWTTLNLHTGPADLNVNGKSGVTYLYSAGNGKADLRNFITDDCFVSNKSTNSCYVNAAKELDAKINSIGDIYYTGTFYSLTSDITGSGHLIPF